MSSPESYNPVPEDVREAAGLCIKAIDARLNEMYRAPKVMNGMKTGPSLEELMEAARKEDPDRTPLALMAHICVGENFSDGGNRGLILNQPREYSLSVAALHAVVHGFQDADDAAAGLEFLLSHSKQKEVKAFVGANQAALEEALTAAKDAGGRTPSDTIRATSLAIFGQRPQPGQS